MLAQESNATQQEDDSGDESRAGGGRLNRFGGKKATRSPDMNDTYNDYEDKDDYDSEEEQKNKRKVE